MYATAVRQRARTLATSGLTDGEVAARLGLPRSTVREWRTQAWPESSLCPRCWRRTKPIVIEPESFAELLGLYLGDGCISKVSRTYSLRLALDARYPTIAAEARMLMQRVFPANRVRCFSADGGSTLMLCVYSSHLPCVFPQHGAGKKHQRTIALESWQQDLVDRAPWSLLRGLIRSDGCVFVNCTGAYRYDTYEFRNQSSDLLDLFSQTCDRVGVDHRRTPERIRINRRNAVAAMLAPSAGKADGRRYL
jgi:hypothetical protein